MNRGSFRTPLEPFSFAQYLRSRRRARARSHRCSTLRLTTRIATGDADESDVNDFCRAADGVTDPGQHEDEIGWRVPFPCWITGERTKPQGGSRTRTRSGNGFKRHSVCNRGESKGRKSRQKRLTRLRILEDGCTNTMRRRGEACCKRLERDQHSPRHSSLAPLTSKYGFTTTTAEGCRVYGSEGDLTISRRCGNVRPRSVSDSSCVGSWIPRRGVLFWVETGNRLLVRASDRNPLDLLSSFLASLEVPQRSMNDLENYLVDPEP
jgi:hypothetical protein